jgi:ABC-type nitrate/sulfonate/bicarbonate transport system permease component
MWSLVSLAVLLGLWWGLILLFHLNSFFAKSPADVWSYMFSGSGAVANRTLLLSNLATTLADAGAGFVVGTVAGVVCAVLIVSSLAVEQTLLPMAIAVRCIPLIAMTPLLALIFGTGFRTVTVVAGLATFFPTLVNVIFGLKSTPRAALKLMTAYAATPTHVMLRVRFPYALPSLFASARIAAPGALLGAILSEWLVTGKGLGGLMVFSASSSDWAAVWAAVVLVTMVSIVFYNIVSAIERVTLAKYAPHHLRST